MLIIVILYINYSPIKRLNVSKDKVNYKRLTKPNLMTYKVITHVHTQFSFDSLGKPSDIKKAMEENNIDFVFITDHNNCDYRYFEDDKIFAGIEKNTDEGRLLLLGNTLPVISHPHNFDFEHYKWKGEFKEGYIYEFIDIKDVIVWNKLKTALTLIKNIILYPITRNIIYKWNSLIPIERWRNLYYTRAKHQNIIGGLDIHIKFVYQEKTHGLLIPSYRDSFRWVVNVVYSRKELKSKDEVLESLKNGNLYLSINKNFIDIWAEDTEGIKLLGEKVKKGGKICLNIQLKKFVCKIFKDNQEIVTTTLENFEFELNEKGKYWVEVYEYDFNLLNIFFGLRVVAITNSFWVEE